MARSHHRKKHKAHLQQFRHHNDATDTVANSKSRATVIFAIGGLLFGFAIAYFATSGSLAWMIGAALTGGLAGYLIGKRIDES
jgi:hypothetical protein